ncbi:MAG: YncE family protein [Chloroflexi bacterium]|nr:YncE family protein [Chloroflexota bacterium]
MSMISRSYRRIMLFTWMLLLLPVCWSPPVHADGGAPNLAYVSGTAQGISVIDTGAARITKTISLGDDPHTILLSQDGRLLYVTLPGRGQVVVIAAKTGRTICTAHLPGTPTLLALDQESNTLYAGGNGATGVSAIDPETCKIEHTFQIESAVNGLAVTAPEIGTPHTSKNQLWVAGTDALNVFDDRTGQLLGRISVPGGPQYISFPPGTTVYVTTRQGGVDAVNFQTRKVSQLLTGGTFGPMDYDALTGEVYVPDQKHSELAVLSPIDPSMTILPKEPVRVIPTGVPPETVAITNDGLLGFVALQNGEVKMIDLLGRRFAYTVNVGGNPHFIITGLYPPTTDLTPTPTPSQQKPFWSTLPAWAIPASILVYLLVFFTLVWFFLRMLRRTLRERHHR